MFSSIRKTAMAVAALAAFALGGAAIAGAAGKTNATASKTRRQAAAEALSSDDAAKVKAAALKGAGATVLRTEAGGPTAPPTTRTSRPPTAR